MTLLVAGSAALAAVVLLELRSPEPAGAGVPAPRPVPASSLGGGGGVETKEARAALVEAILARPLFTPGRRVKEDAPAAVVPVADALPRMTAILIDGATRRAIFAGGEGGRPIVVLEGGRIGPFTIQSIDTLQVTVLGPDGKRAVRTSFDPHPPPPVSAALSAGLAPPQGGPPPPGPAIAR
ncbi:MAG TPA: hypothetical protein VE650_20580 [Acetobacteraceae bacterium]|nr:hypothetical protein [Acetobacteraceae bacterium]